MESYNGYRIHLSNKQVKDLSEIVTWEDETVNRKECKKIIGILSKLGLMDLIMVSDELWIRGF